MMKQNRNHDLKRHKRIHLDLKPFKCAKCDKSFSRKDALRRHWLVKGCKGDELPGAGIREFDISLIGLSERGREGERRELVFSFELVLSFKLARSFELSLAIET